MKKFLTLATLILGGLFFAQNVSAQRHDNGHHNGWEHQRPRVERRYDRPVVRDYNRQNSYVETYNGYKDVLVGNDVYRYYYTVYVDRFGRRREEYTGRREYLGHYDSRNRNKFRLNVFLRF